MEENYYLLIKIKRKEKKNNLCTFIVVIEVKQ